MTSDVRNKTTIRRAETGWARARRLRGRGLRTWVPATSGSDTRQMGADVEANIVRGED